MDRNPRVYVWTLKYCVKFEFLCVCTGSGVSVWFGLVQAVTFTCRIIFSCRSSLAPVWQTRRVLQLRHSAWSNCITKIIPITPPPWRFFLLGPLSTLLHVLRWLARLPSCPRCSPSSFSLSQQLKSFIPAEQNGSIHLRPPTSALNCWASPLNPARGGVHSSFPLICPPLLPCHLLFPTILFTDILVVANSDLLRLGRLILLDQYLSFVFSPHLSGLLPCPCPSALV